MTGSDEKLARQVAGLRAKQRQIVDLRLQYFHLLRFLNETLTETNYEQLFRMALTGKEDKCTLIGKKFREKVSLPRAKTLQYTLQLLVQKQPIADADFVFMEPQDLMFVIATDLLYRSSAKLARCPECRMFFLGRRGQVSCGEPRCAQQRKRKRRVQPPRQKARDI